LTKIEPVSLLGLRWCCCYPTPSEEWGRVEIPRNPTFCWSRPKAWTRDQKWLSCTLFIKQDWCSL